MPVSLERVILTLNGSLIETPPWESFLKIMEDYLQCRSSALLFRTPTQGDSGLMVSESHGLTGSPLMIEAYHDSPFLNLPDRQVHVLSRMMPEAVFRKKHPRHYEYNRRLGTIDILAANLTDDETGMSFRFYTMRSKGSEPFGSREAAAVEELLPHLNIAVAIYARMVQQQQQIHISDETSTKLGLGTIVLKADGGILTVNPAADSILQKKRDFYVQRGKLRCADRGAEEKLYRQLRQLAEGALEENEFSLRVAASDGGESSWLLMVRKNDIPREFRDDHSDTISLLIREPQESIAITADHLIQLFELTPAEALLAERLVHGDTLIEAAEKLGRSRSTVRVQLAAIFSKTGVHKQHQLISHIMQTANKLRL